MLVNRRLMQIIGPSIVRVLIRENNKMEIDPTALNHLAYHRWAVLGWLAA